MFRKLSDATASNMRRAGDYMRNVFTKQQDDDNKLDGHKMDMEEMLRQAEHSPFEGCVE
jgi:hypothetical protein